MLQKVRKVEADSGRRLGAVVFKTSEGRENGECGEGDWLGFLFLNSFFFLQL